MIDSFLRHIRNELSLSDNTVAAYRRDLRQWADFATDHGRHALEPQSTTLSDLRLWTASLARAGESPRTIRRKIQSLRAFFRYMMKCHGMTQNPAIGLPLPKTPRTLPVYSRTEETQAMIDAPIDEEDFTEVRNRLILDMFYSTGIRCSGPELTDMINRYRQLRDKTTGTAVETFFTRDDGRPMYRKQVYNVVHQAMSESTHAARKSPHVLRHSFATDMLNSGADLTSVQQLLGHKSLSATQVYTHISYRDLKNYYQLAHPRAQKKGG